MRNCALLLIILLAACTSQNEQNTSVLDTVGSIDDAVAAPVAAPEFSLKSLDGETYSLSALHGKWVIVNFWATWCTPCRAEMPLFQSIYEHYAGKIEILAVNDSDTVEDVEAYRDELGLSFPLLLEPTQETLNQYKVLGLPITVIVDPQGNIAWQRFGEVDLGEFENTVDEFLTSKPSNTGQ